jgi:hypothetical protein
MSDHEGLAIGHSMAEVAADNAGEAWKAEAYAAFRRHAIHNQFFMTEEVRRANEDMPHPPDTRAWGAVALQAKRDGVVVADGWTRANSRSVHGMVVTKWRSTIYRGKDESNNN